MIQALKDARRRTAQSILATTGTVETTKDEAFDVHIEKFDRMIQDMNECGAALYSFLNHQKAVFSDAEELSKSMARIFQMNKAINDWPNVECRLNHNKEAEKYAQIMSSIHNVVRSSSSTICCELAIDPLRAMVTKVGPEVHAMKKERNTKLTDYDSFRRRLKEKEDKKIALENVGKGDTPAANDLAVEIEKFEKKVELGLEEYNHLNNKVKSDIIDAKTHHDDLMDDLLITTIVCQSELFFQAANELESVIEKFPEHKVLQVRKRIHRLIKAGGVQPTTKAEKTALQKAVAIATGKALPSDFQKPSTEEVVVVQKNIPPVPIAAAAVVPITTEELEQGGLTSAAWSRNELAKKNIQNARLVNTSTTALTDERIIPTSYGSNPFGSENYSSSNPFVGENCSSSNPFNDVTGLNSSTAINPPPLPTNLYRALYDQIAEDDDEINFKVGDIIEVVDKIEDGWWKGKVVTSTCSSGTSSIGVFPSNFVTKI